MPTPRPGPTQPPHRPSCPAGTGRVQRPGHQIEAFQGGLLRGEVPSGLDRAAVAGIERLDGYL